MKSALPTDMTTECAKPSQPKFLTKDGLIRLGQLIRYCRELRGWTLDYLEAAISAKFPDTAPAKKTIANIELGVAVKQPNYNNLSAIAAMGFVIDLQTGQSLTIDDFIDIASEQKNVFIPETEINNELLSLGMDDFIEEIRAVVRCRNQTLEDFAQDCFTQERPNTSKVERLNKILDNQSNLDDSTDWSDVILVALFVPSFINSDRNTANLKRRLKGLPPTSGGSGADLNDGGINGRRPNSKVRR